MPTDRLIWFFVICGLTAVGLIWGMRDTRRVIEAPFLYATGMALILCPQLYVVSINPGRVPDEAYWVHSIMVLLSTIALYWGYLSSPSTPRVHPDYIQRWLINDTRLFKLGVFVAGLGTIGYYKVYSMPEVVGLWTGWPVYWITLAKFALPGISMLLLSYVQSGKRGRLVTAALFSIFPFLAIVTAGRRSMMIVLPLIYLLPFLVYRPKLRIPIPLVIASLVVVFIVVYAVPYWRDQFDEGQHVQAVREKPLSEIMGEIFAGDSDKVLEVADSMIVIGARYQEGNYEWGMTLYNSLIESYVPGSLIGHDIKDAFMIGEGRSLDWIEAAYDMPVAFYTAKNGYSDLFGQFSFLGAIIMFLIGKGYRRVSDAIALRGDGRAILFLAFFITFPAAIAYGEIFYGIVLQVPALIAMWLTFRWCTVKQTLVRVRPEGSIRSDGMGRLRFLNRVRNSR